MEPVTAVDAIMCNADETREKQERIFKLNHDYILGLPEIDENIAALVLHSLELFADKQKRYEKGNLSFTSDDLKEVLRDIYLNRSEQSIVWNEIFDFYRISGKRGTGNVHFTGYYSPVIKVRDKADHLYRHPVYRMPKIEKGKLPTRYEIDGCGALKDKKLEIAYANNPIDIYFTQLQGSGVLEYENGDRSFLAYGGSNKYGFANLNPNFKEAGVPSHRLSKSGLKVHFRKHPELVDSILHLNPSYTFFKRKKKEPYGAIGNTLYPMSSIAVDPKYIPLGSVLLAAFPEVDEKGKLHGFSYKLLFANDVGGAIKGPGHIDVYTGVSDEGETQARRLNHYGALWLILPKKPLASNE